MIVYGSQTQQAEGVSRNVSGDCLLLVHEAAYSDESALSWLVHEKRWSINFTLDVQHHESGTVSTTCLCEVDCPRGFCGRSMCRIVGTGHAVVIFVHIAIAQTGLRAAPGIGTEDAPGHASGWFSTLLRGKLLAVRLIRTRLDSDG